MAQGKTAARPPSLSEWIAAELTKDIVLGDIPPGAVLREADVAERFRTSRGPCREAFSILARRGFLETAPYRSNLVRNLAEQEIRQLTECRLLLDPAAAALAAERAAEPEIEKMQLLAEAAEAAARAGNRSAFYDAAREIRTTLLDATYNAFLREMAETITHQADRLRLGSVESPAALLDRSARMNAIVAAIEQREPETAAGLMTEGIRAAEQAALAAIRERT